METTLRRIISIANKVRPEFGEYVNYMNDPFTFGINVLTTTSYTLGISKELIKDFENGLNDISTITNRIKIKKEPNK